MPERLYSVPEAAALIGVHVETLRIYLRRGEIQATKLGGINNPKSRWRIPQSEIDRLTKPSTAERIVEEKQ